MTTVKQLIKDIIASYDASLDLTDSSSMTDLFVNPASALMEPFIAQITYLLESLGMLDPESINTAELDAIGANFLIERTAGTKGSGYVELLYTTPQSITVPIGTTFTSVNGIEFATTQSVYVSLDTMQQNAWNYPYYSSGPIPVEAVTVGAITSIGINEIASTSFEPAPARVTNPSAFSGGSDGETNTEYVNRLVVEVVSGALGSAVSMRTTLRKSFPTIMETEVRGMHDDEMLRDLVVSGVSLADVRQVIDFYGKVSGLNELPHPESQAYYSVFYDDPTTSGIQPDLPGVEYFVNEFTDDLYDGLYTLGDAVGATVNTKIILEDDFATGTRWLLSDGIAGLGLQTAPNELQFEDRDGSHRLRLGYRYTGPKIGTMPVTVPADFMWSVINYLQRCTALSMNIADWHVSINDYMDWATFRIQLGQLQTSTEYVEMVTQIVNTIKPETAGNYFPIATATLPEHAGITMTGTFETDDDTTDGKLSYVTVLRDENSLDPSNGYGFAWMKGDGSKYNVYLVDNSAMANDLFINKDNVVNPQGENAWKAAARMVIDASTDVTKNVYNYELTVGVDYAMSLKIWKVGTSEPVTPTVTCGAPSALPAANGSKVGFGVLGTTNSQWWYGGITVTTSNGIHTATLFQLKAHATDFPNGSDVTVDYYGYGHDGVGGSTNWGITAFIRKKVGGVWTWVEIGTNTSTDTTDHELTKISTTFEISSDYRDTAECVYLLATSTYATTEVTEVTTYYVSLTDTTLSGIHTGGCADIYINDTSKILLAENTLNNVSGSIALSKANGFYIPLHSIVQVQTALVGEDLAVNSDWVLESSAGEAYAYSTLEEPKIVFNPALIDFSVRIVYRHYQSGEAIQTLLDSPENRYSGTSNLAKCMPPAIVTINSLDYRGTPSLTTMIGHIKDYVNGAGNIISLDDILNTLYSKGASWIDVVNTDITVTQYDYRRVMWDPVQLETTYTLDPALSRFFADDTSLNGLRRL